MNATLEYIVKKFGVDLNQKLPIVIPTANREAMARTLGELGFTEGAEIGVAKGEHAALLCLNNPSLHLYAVDPWEMYPRYRDYSADRLHYFYRSAQKHLQPYNVSLVRKSSMDAVTDFADGQLDFVYIDGAHDFKNVAMDICEWAWKVRVGGIVYGHDYLQGKRTLTGAVREVKHVVQAYTYTKGIRPWFVLGTTNRRSPLYDGGQNWMFVRQEGDYL